MKTQWLVVSTISMLFVNVPVISAAEPTYAEIQQIAQTALNLADFAGPDIAETTFNTYVANIALDLAVQQGPTSNEELFAALVSYLAKIQRAACLHGRMKYGAELPPYLDKVYQTHYADISLDGPQSVTTPTDEEATPDPESQPQSDYLDEHRDGEDPDTYYYEIRDRLVKKYGLSKEEASAIAEGLAVTAAKHYKENEYYKVNEPQLTEGAPEVDLSFAALSDEEIKAQKAQRQLKLVRDLKKQAVEHAMRSLTIGALRPILEVELAKRGWDADTPETEEWMEYCFALVTIGVQNGKSVEDAINDAVKQVPHNTKMITVNIDVYAPFVVDGTAYQEHVGQSGSKPSRVEKIIQIFERIAREHYRMETEYTNLGVAIAFRDRHISNGIQEVRRFIEENDIDDPGFAAKLTLMLVDKGFLYRNTDALFASRVNAFLGYHKIDYSPVVIVTGPDEPPTLDPTGPQPLYTGPDGLPDPVPGGGEDPAHEPGRSPLDVAVWIDPDKKKTIEFMMPKPSSTGKSEHDPALDLANPDLTDPDSMSDVTFPGGKQPADAPFEGIEIELEEQYHYHSLPPQGSVNSGGDLDFRLLSNNAATGTRPIIGVDYFGGTPEGVGLVADVPAAVTSFPQGTDAAIDFPQGTDAAIEILTEEILRDLASATVPGSGTTSGNAISVSPSSQNLAGDWQPVPGPWDQSLAQVSGLNGAVAGMPPTTIGPLPTTTVFNFFGTALINPVSGPGGYLGIDTGGGSMLNVSPTTVTDGGMTYNIVPNSFVGSVPYASVPGGVQSVNLSTTYGGMTGGGGAFFNFQGGTIAGTPIPTGGGLNAHLSP